MSRSPGWLRLYLSGDRRLEWLVASLRGGWDGVWLGLLTPDQLARLDEAYYTAENVYRTEAHNRRGLFAWEARLVQVHFRPASRIAVLGAGGGREVVALLAEGHDVWGYEPLPELAAFASALTTVDGHGRRVAVMSRDGWTANPGSFDAVLVGWGAYMLIPTPSARVDLLRRAAGATRGDGVVVTSFFTMPPDRRQFHVAYRIARLLRRLLGRPAPLLGDALVPNYAHHFTRGQIVEELSAAGLELIEWGTADGGYGWAVARRSSERQGAENA